jgi:3'-phosphoadenosine 5'-phosphosulfate sulfotransferase (PAPS reductase)/FAD synthetase
MAITKSELQQMQSLPLHLKLIKSRERIREWFEYWNGRVVVSFSGGIDSTVLLHMVRQQYPNVKAMFCDTGLEYPEIRSFVKSISNVDTIRPAHSFKYVIEKHGYPVVSKTVADGIADLQRAGPNNTATVNLRLTGITRAGRFCPSRMIPKKWLFLKDAPFKVSDHCCNVLKKDPLHKYAHENNVTHMTAEMACDSKTREKNYMESGCNAFASKLPKSTPMGFWTRQDVLTYIKVFNLPYSSVYGEIIYDHATKQLETTGEQRTGCMFCMFGVHMEGTPNRFERMKVTHPKHYAVCMNLGCGAVMDYIGVRY